MSRLEPLRRILLLTDFSPNSRSAQQRALTLALGHGARLIVAFSFDLPVAPAGLPGPPRDIVDRYRALSQEGLQRLESELARRGAAVESRFVEGTPHRALLELAEELVPDLVVLGTRGLSGVRKLLLGSTALRLVRRSRFAVLTVPRKASRRQLPIERALVATDFSPHARRAVDAALRLLAGTPGSTLHLLHVVSPPFLYTPEGTIPTPLRYLESQTNEAEARLAALARDLRATAASVGVEVRTRQGEPAQTILEDAAELAVDLIALGTRGLRGLDHWILGSTAEKVVQHADRPVLTTNLDCAPA